MNLLLEIGAEETRIGCLQRALWEYLGGAAGDLMKAHRVGRPFRPHRRNPRRLVVRAEGVIAQQPDSGRTSLGEPAKNAPPAAVAGFAKKQGLEPDQLEILSEGESGEIRRSAYARSRDEYCQRDDPCRKPCRNSSSKRCSRKSMYWTGKGGEVNASSGPSAGSSLFSTIGGDPDVRNCRHPRGQRNRAAIASWGRRAFLPTYENYEQKLRENFVILSADERRKRIRAVSTKYKCDNDLLSTLVNLTEWPTPITGSFDPSFTGPAKRSSDHGDAAPPEVFFGPKPPTVILAPQFVAVTNTG